MKKLPYNPQITTDQHFVPSHFLSAWCCDGMLWVSNRDFKLFSQKPENVAKERGIYSLEYMTADEFMTSFSGIRNLAKGLDPALLKMIMDGMVSNLLYREICDGQLSREEFNRIISFIDENSLCSAAEVSLLKLVWIIYETGEVPSDIKHFCKKHFVEGIEPFATKVEQNAYPLIESLRSGDLSFLGDLEKRESLFLYISLQMFRVRKFTNIAEHYGLIDSKTLKLSRIILVARTLDFLMRNWSNEEFRIVDNTTSLEFITGDNPICNLDAHDKPKYLDLYFPISSDKAIFLCEKDRVLLYPEMRKMTTHYVHSLNREIAAGSSFQVFAKSRETLLSGGYRPSFDFKSKSNNVMPSTARD